MRTRNAVTVSAILFAGLVFALWPATDTAAPQSSADTVLVPVNVTDSKNVPVTTLKLEHFQILEDNKEQKITSVSLPGEPMTLGIVMAMSSNGPIKTPGQSDRITVEISDGIKKVQEAHGLGLLPPSVDQLPFDSDGHYPLITRSISAMEKEGARRKALVVVSDGLIAAGSSKDTMQMPKNLIELARRVQFPIYFMFTYSGSTEPSLTESSNYVIGFNLQLIAEASGGQVFPSQVDNNVISNATRLRDSLKSQYVLGFTSTNPVKDGKSRKLTVKVNPPAELTKLKVTAKTKYYVAKADGGD